MHATPSPRSTSDAPEFFLTTPFDFFATAIDQTPVGACIGSNVARFRSQYDFPEEDCEFSEYQLFCPDASNFSTFAAMGRLSFFMRATLASTPAAFHNSNGPSSQLKPSRIAWSISTTESEISGIRFAQYVQRSESADHRNVAALSGFCVLAPSM